MQTYNHRVRISNTLIIYPVRVLYDSLRGWISRVRRVTPWWRGNTRCMIIVIILSRVNVCTGGDDGNDGSTCPRSWPTNCNIFYYTYFILNSRVICLYLWVKSPKFSFTTVLIYPDIGLTYVFSRLYQRIASIDKHIIIICKSTYIKTHLYEMLDRLLLKLKPCQSQ